MVPLFWGGVRLGPVTACCSEPWSACPPRNVSAPPAPEHARTDTRTGSWQPVEGGVASDLADGCAVVRSLDCIGSDLSFPTDVDVIVKFAQLEFQLGDAERAKALFENTLSTYPKRTDVWSVYIDMIIKHGSQREVR